MFCVVTGCSEDERASAVPRPQCVRISARLGGFCHMNNLNATYLINDVNAAGCLLQLVRICIAVWAALRLRCYSVLRAG